MQQPAYFSRLDGSKNRVSTVHGNQEFGCSLFQTGDTRGIFLKILKAHFYTGNLLQTL